MKAILIDTSVIVRERATQDPAHPVAVRAIEQLIDHGWMLCVVPQCLIEFWSVATRPADARGGLGLTVAEAQTAIEEFIATHRLLLEPPDVFVRWYTLAHTHAVHGRQVWDARIVACMEAHSISYLLTFNQVDFQRYTSIHAVNPRDVSQILDTSG
ncbi:MAG: PIN domain-containing protein [Fimbriimonadales bacterium]